MSTGDNYRQYTNGEPDPAGGLCVAIRLLAETTENPCVLIGALIEGAVYTAYRSVPYKEQSASAAAMLRLLIERIDAYGLARSPEGTGSGGRSGL